MIWVILFLVIIVISLVLAYRSMKTFEEVPVSPLSYGLFLIRNLANFNEELLEKLYKLGLFDEAPISLERVFKGNEEAKIIYCPKSLAVHLSELDLLEIEDYLVKTEPKFLDSVSGFLISPKNNPQKDIQVDHGFLTEIPLEATQQIFWQMVLKSVKGGEQSFQSTIRVLVSEPDSNKRIELLKMLNLNINEKTGLIQQSRDQTATEVYNAFQIRSLIPKEVSAFILKKSEILNLIYSK